MRRREYAVLRIYHGSERIIEKTVFGYGKKKNDYGLGFYCTQDINLAMEWSVDIDRDGYVNLYDIDETGLSIMNLNDSQYSVLNWISILINNRDFQINSPIAAQAKQFLLDKYLPDYEKFDIIRGYRADDSYFSFARDFLNNTISLEQLSAAMHYGNLGEQIVLKSKEAFDRICYVGFEKVDSKLWYPRKESRDSLARNKYFNLDKNTFKKGETYIIRILEEEL